MHSFKKPSWTVSSGGKNKIKQIISSADLSQIHSLISDPDVLVPPTAARPVCARQSRSASNHLFSFWIIKKKKERKKNPTIDSYNSRRGLLTSAGLTPPLLYRMIVLR